MEDRLLCQQKLDCDHVIKTDILTDCDSVVFMSPEAVLGNKWFNKQNSQVVHLSFPNRASAGAVTYLREIEHGEGKNTYGDYSQVFVVHVVWLTRLCKHACMHCEWLF